MDVTEKLVLKSNNTSVKKNKYLIANKILWLLVAASFVTRLSFNITSDNKNGQLILLYNLAIIIPVIGIALLHWLKDPALRYLYNKFNKLFPEKNPQSRVNVLSENKKEKTGRLNKKNLIFIILLSLVFVNAWLLLSVNLGVLPLQNDEFLTVNAVEYIADGNFQLEDLKYGADYKLSDEFYSRALPYSLGAALTVKLLGGDYTNYANLRMFSVVSVFLALVVFYFLLRRYFTKITLLFTLYGLSIFYLFICHARIARMYAFHLLLFFLMVLLVDRMFSWIQKERIERRQSLGESARYYLVFVKKNIFYILLFFIVLGVDLKTHIHGIFIVPVIYVYSLMLLKNHRQLFYPFVFMSGVLVLFLALFFSGNHFVGDWYLNTQGKVYWKFIEFNFANLKGGYLAMPIFLFPLFFYRLLPSIIKLSYAAFFTIVPMYVFFFNGSVFHDPRYMIFIYPFFIITVIYSLYLISSLIFSWVNNKLRPWLVTGLFFLLFILIISPVKVSGVCSESFLLTCPENHHTRIFSLDRWNYNHDEYFQIIKENITRETVIVSRSIYDFYLEKYELENEIMRLAEGDKNYFKKSQAYTITDLESKDIIFIVYSQLSYSANATASLDPIYIYLYKERRDKEVLYHTENNKVMVFHLNKLRE